MNARFSFVTWGSILLLSVGCAMTLGACGSTSKKTDGGSSCSLATDCPGQDSECATRTCRAGKCGIDYSASGTAVSNQTTGDCKKNVCDGAGNVTAIDDNTDFPDDQNPCTTDSCSNGMPQHTPVSPGTSCGTNLVCDVNGQCVGTLVLKAITLVPNVTIWDVNVKILLHAIWTGTDGTDTQDVSSQVAWTVTPSANATVPPGSWVLQALAPGDVTVTANWQGLTSNPVTITFVVTDPARLMRIHVTPTSRILAVGATQPFTATAYYGDLSTKDVSSQVVWTLTSSSAATIDATGKLTASAVGDLLVTASLPEPDGNAASDDHALVAICDPADPSSIASALVGPSGATLTLSDLTVTFPAGAMSQPTPVAIAPFDATLLPLGPDFQVISGIYLVDATDVTLAQPAQVTLALAPGTLGATDVPMVALDHGDGWELYDATYDPITNAVQAQTAQFSGVGAAKLPPPPPGRCVGSWSYPLPGGCVIQGVPFHTQNQQGWCHQATTAMVASYYGKMDVFGGTLKFWEITALEPNPLIFGSKAGNDQPASAGDDLLHDLFGLTTAGYSFSMVGGIHSGCVGLRNFVTSSIASGQPVLVSLGGGLGHAFVILGYDSTDVYYHDSSGDGYGGPCNANTLGGIGGHGDRYGHIAWSALVQGAFNAAGILRGIHAWKVLGAPATPQGMSIDMSFYAGVAEGYFQLQGKDNGHPLHLALDGRWTPTGYHYTENTSYPGPGYSPSASAFYPQAAGDATLNLDATLLPGDISLAIYGHNNIANWSARYPPDYNASNSPAISYTIRDPNGQPVWNGTGPTIPVVEQEQFMTNGTYTLTATTSDGTSSDTLNLLFPYLPTTSVVGKVRQQQGGNWVPANGAKVVVRGGLNKDGKPAEATTIADGSFRIDWVDFSGLPQIQVDATSSDGSQSGSSVPVPVDPSDVNVGEDTDVGEICPCPNGNCPGNSCSCGDTSSDPNNCGSCGYACGTWNCRFMCSGSPDLGYLCVNGICTKDCAACNAICTGCHCCGC